MFEHSFVDAGARTHRPWTVVVSTTLQMAALAAAFVVPMVHPDLLPRMAFATALLSPPPALVPEPPVLARAVEVVKKYVPLFNGFTLIEPTSMPPKARFIDEPDPGAGLKPAVGIGVFGGTGQPLPGSIVNDILKRAAVPPPPPPVEKPTAAAAQQTIIIRQGGDIQEALLISRVIPPYPPLAKQAGIQGKVIFSAIVGRDGTIVNLQFVSGHPLLQRAAFDAVRQWRYRPTLLNGQPVDVQTSIEVNFILNR